MNEDAKDAIVEDAMYIPEDTTIECKASIDSPLPETDGWDEAADRHWKVRWLRRIYLLCGIVTMFLILPAVLFSLPV